MTSSGFADWLAAYGRAWETRNPDAAAALFAEDAAYHETPFAGPATGRTAIHHYWEAATRNQRDIRFCSEIVAMASAQGIARWSAEFTRAPSGARVKLDGIFLLEFDEHGLCRRLREWWHRTELPRPK